MYVGTSFRFTRQMPRNVALSTPHLSDQISFAPAQHPVVAIFSPLPIPELVGTAEGNSSVALLSHPGMYFCTDPPDFKITAPCIGFKVPSGFQLFTIKA